MRMSARTRQAGASSSGPGLVVRSVAALSTSCHDYKPTSLVLKINLLRPRPCAAALDPSYCCDWFCRISASARGQCAQRTSSCIRRNRSGVWLQSNVRP